MNVTDYVTRTRSDQDLPPKVEDPAALARVATLLDVGGEADD